MNNQSELDKLFNQTQDKLAEGISAILRSLGDRNERIQALRSMENNPSIEVLKRINKIAIKKEDYETCEALNEYSKEKGINL